MAVLVASLQIFPSPRAPPCSNIGLMRLLLRWLRLCCSECWSQSLALLSSDST